MIRRYSILLFSILSIFSCKREERSKSIIITSIYPLYTITDFIVDDQVEVVNLIPPGVSPHTYELSPEDMLLISKAKIIIYMGEGLETWLRSAINESKARKVALTDYFILDNNNPHIWLDPVYTKRMVEIIEKEIEKSIKGINLSKIQRRKEILIDSLDRLHREIEEELKYVKRRAYMAYHPAFHYFAKRYNLKEYVISESPSKKLSPGDMQRAGEIIRKYDIKVIFTEKQNPSNVPYILARDYGIKVLKLDPIGEKDKTYFEILRENLNTFKKGLNE